MMFGGYETIEAYEDDLYREESSSESVDSEVEFHLYSQVHYAQDLGNAGEEEHEEKDSGSSESPSSKANQKNLIILSDSEVIQLSDGSEVITLSDEDSIYRCKRKNIRVQPQEKTQCPPAFIHSNELADKKCKRAIEKPKPEERSDLIREVMIIEVSSSEEEDSTISESDNVESWMLLGCEVDDDKDDDILLNLVGCENTVNEGQDGVNWFISDKDVEAHIGNNRSSGRWTHRYYSANKNVTCRNCDKCGHLSKNCPLPQKVRPCCLCSERGHLQYACPARFCLDCSLPMSSTHRCLKRTFWRKRCDRCDMIGHYADKTKILTTGPISNSMINGEKIEVVKDFILLGSAVNTHGSSRQEIKRYIALGRSAAKDLFKVLKSKDVTLKTKVHLTQAIVFSVTSYACRSRWTMNKEDRRIIDAFELCWQRILNILWTAKRMNKSVLEEVQDRMLLRSKDGETTCYILWTCCR
ncbi:zinc finger CCHC domain-containing protein 7 isoform 2-T3 [Dugong dugon]